MASRQDKPEDNWPIQANPHSTELNRFRSVVMDILAHPKKLHPTEIVKLLPSDNRFTTTLKILFDKDEN